MVDTFDAVVVVVVGLMPGALYSWSFERIAGRWGIGLMDRFLRFAVGSLALHALAAPLTYSLYARFISTGRISRGEPLSFWLWLISLSYVIAPVLAGTLVGLGSVRGATWARFLTGPHPVPRAFDHLFSSRPTGWVRVRLVSGGTWVGGAYARHPSGRSSYASQYPEAGDLYLVSVALVDPITGEFMLNPDGTPQLREDRGVLIRSADFDYLEFLHA
jgi:hypothetical protein